jgi:hypothetical protein
MTAEQTVATPKSTNFVVLLGVAYVHTKLKIDIGPPQTMNPDVI